MDKIQNVVYSEANEAKGGEGVGTVLGGFQIKRFLNDYQRWVSVQQANTSLSSIRTADELVSFITNAESEHIRVSVDLIRDMEMWMDVTIEEMIKTFKKHRLDTRSALLFIRENQERYLNRFHMIRCNEGHVQGLFPTNEGVDGDVMYCRYCDNEFEAPPKLHQTIVYNWIDQHA